MVNGMTVFVHSYRHFLQQRDCFMLLVGALGCKGFPDIVRYVKPFGRSLLTYFQNQLHHCLDFKGKLLKNDNYHNQKIEDLKIEPNKIQERHKADLEQIELLKQQIQEIRKPQEKVDKLECLIGKRKQPNDFGPKMVEQNSSEISDRKIQKQNDQNLSNKAHLFIDCSREDTQFQNKDKIQTQIDPFTQTTAIQNEIGIQSVATIFKNDHQGSSMIDVLRGNVSSTDVVEENIIPNPGQSQEIDANNQSSLMYKCSICNQQIRDGYYDDHMLAHGFEDDKRIYHRLTHERKQQYGRAIDKKKERRDFDDRGGRFGGDRDHNQGGRDRFDRNDRQGSRDRGDGGDRYNNQSFSRDRPDRGGDKSERNDRYGGGGSRDRGQSRQSNPMQRSQDYGPSRYRNSRRDDSNADLW